MVSSVVQYFLQLLNSLNRIMQSSLGSQKAAELTKNSFFFLRKYCMKPSYFQTQFNPYLHSGIRYLCSEKYYSQCMASIFYKKNFYSDRNQPIHFDPKCQLNFLQKESTLLTMCHQISIHQKSFTLFTEKEHFSNSLTIKKMSYNFFFFFKLRISRKIQFRCFLTSFFVKQTLGGNFYYEEKTNTYCVHTHIRKKNLTYLQRVFNLDSILLCRRTIRVKQAPMSRVAPEKQKLKINNV